MISWVMIEPGPDGMKNFHLPLPEALYATLREEAERAQVPATVMAREALDGWLRERRRRARREAIAVYASEMAGTMFDLDPELERAGLEQLAEER